MYILYNYLQNSNKTIDGGAYYFTRHVAVRGADYRHGTDSHCVSPIFFNSPLGLLVEERHYPILHDI